MHILEKEGKVCPVKNSFSQSSVDESVLINLAWFVVIYCIVMLIHDYERQVSW